MTPAALGAALIVWIAAITSPGPDTLQIIRLGSVAKKAGIACALGICLGNVMWITASLLGMSALVTAHPSIIDILKILGGAYLASIAYRAAQAARRLPNKTSQLLPSAAVAAHRFGSSLKTGLFTNLSNPKAILFFASIFAQFLRQDDTPLDKVVLASMLIVVEMIWFVGLALFVRGAAKKLLTNTALVEGLSAVIFAVVAAVMVGTGITGLFRHC